MSKIEYVDIPARKEVRVYIGKKRVGTICKLTSGYEYRPKGSTHLRGQLFQTLRECKISLETE